jgi:hypothetical protein
MAQTLACYNHPNIAATATCADCGAGICAACTRTLRGQPFCPADYAIMRHEPPGAHLPVEVPSYQPAQYHYQLPVLEAESAVVNVPLPSGSLFGSGLVSTTPPALEVQPRGPSDWITKCARVGIACPLLIVVSIFGSIAIHLNPPGWVIASLPYLIPGLAAIGMIINIVTLMLQRRSNRPDTVTTLGCMGIFLNGIILALTALLFEFATIFRI